jgi:hypothetical protein
VKYRAELGDDDGWTEWIQPVRRGYRLRCCDCDLVHEMDFRIKAGRPQFRARRHERATSASRRGKK